MATVRYFAAAAEAAGTTEEQVPAQDLGSLLDHLAGAHGAELARVLRRSSVLHEGQYVTDRGLVLRHDSVLDVLPPFAGG
jgi:sulfur-carrier protein